MIWSSVRNWKVRYELISNDYRSYIYLTRLVQTIQVSVCWLSSETNQNRSWNARLTRYLSQKKQTILIYHFLQNIFETHSFTRKEELTRLWHIVWSEQTQSQVISPWNSGWLAQTQCREEGALYEYLWRMILEMKSWKKEPGVGWCITRIPFSCPFSAA